MLRQGPQKKIESKYPPKVRIAEKCSDIIAYLGKVFWEASRAYAAARLTCAVDCFRCDLLCVTPVDVEIKRRIDGHGFEFRDCPGVSAVLGDAGFKVCEKCHQSCLLLRVADSVSANIWEH